ncbi:hypothetical protein YC2023_109650 [Brassica napus]
MPLRNHKFEQKQNTERPQPVAPTSRSRLRERPRCVAARGRSGLVLASPGDENASDFSLSLWYGRSELRERLQHVALEGRSERPCAVALDESLRDVVHSDLMPSLREVAPAVLVQRSLFSPLLSSK